MSSVSTKSLLLSQPKTVLTGETPTQTLPYTLNHTELSTEIKVEIPGVDPATVNVGLENNTLSVKCQRGELTLPVNPTIDTSKIKADVQWGILTLTVPLPAPPECRNIKVGIHDAVKKSPSKFTEED